MILTDLYLALMAQLTTEEVGIKHFDLWNLQTEETNEDGEAVIPYATPAVFMNIQPHQWENRGNRKQQAELLFDLIVVTDDNIDETDSNETEERRNRGLEHLKILDKVYTAVHGFTAENISTCKRVSISPDQNHDHVIGHVMTFETLLTDTAAAKEYVQAESPTGNITNPPNIIDPPQ